MVSTTSSSGLTTRLSGSARDIAVRLGLSGGLRPFRNRKAKADAASASGTLDLSRRLHAPILPDAPAKALWAETEAKYAAMASAEGWDTLLADLRAADRVHSSATAGRRMSSLISAGARAGLSAAIARQDCHAAEDELARLAAVATARPTDYAAAHLLAQAHLDMGWACRAAAAAGDHSRADWKGFLTHTAEAEQVLDDFDPIEERSPLLAGTRYLLIRGIEDGEALCRDWYEDWSDLDPTNSEPHMVHAVHLLPNWYGTLAKFDDEARTAARRTEKVSGAAAYADFYLSAAATLGNYPARMDLGMFLRGLIDYHRQTDCQYRANIVAARLTELAQMPSGEGRLSALQARMVHEVLDNHLRDNLREFHLSAWKEGIADVHWAIEHVFRPELARGEHVVLGPEGLETRPG